MVGKTEEELTKDGVPYEIGVAHYREIARGAISATTTGVLKLLFHRETRKLLGVHIIGTAATELVHIGQAVLGVPAGRSTTSSRRSSTTRPSPSATRSRRSTPTTSSDEERRSDACKGGAESSLSPPRPRNGARSRPPARHFRSRDALPRLPASFVEPPSAIAAFSCQNADRGSTSARIQCFVVRPLSIRRPSGPAFVPIRSTYGVRMTASGTPVIRSVRTMSSSSPRRGSPSCSRRGVCIPPVAMKRVPSWTPA